MPNRKQVVILLSVTETLTTQEAAKRLDVTVQKFHRLVLRHRLDPAVKAPGLRGAMFWNTEDIDRLGAELAAAESQAS